MTLRAFRQDGTEVRRGDTITDFRGDEHVFHAATRAPDGHRTGKVQADNGHGPEFYMTVFGLTVRDVPDPVYTREQVSTAFEATMGLLEGVTDASPASGLITRTWRYLRGDGPFTREQVTGALNRVANKLDDAVSYESSEIIWEQDVRNLAVNTAGYVLDHPDATLAEAIATGYREIDLDFGNLPEDATEPEPGTPEHDAAIVATVLGWVS
jgi:hypothetical protein